jgi:hypothetical protein
MDQVKADLGQQCLTCPPGDVGMIRTQAALCDSLLATLRSVVYVGELEYDANRTK